MKNLFTLLDEVSHQLNSPLASAKSYTYLARRASEKGDTVKLDTHLKALDEKLDLLARRVDLILTALRLQNTKMSLAYEFFPLSVLTDNESHSIEIMADKTLMHTAFTYAQELTGSNNWNVSSNKMSLIAALPVHLKPTSDNKDIRTEFIEKAVILHATIKQHGGSVEETDKELKISLPLKPKG